MVSEASLTASSLPPAALRGAQHLLSSTLIDFCPAVITCET